MNAKRFMPVFLIMNCCGALSPVKDSVVHHVLDPLVANRSLRLANPSIAINRPAIPTYLDRQQLVTRDGGQIMISDSDLWGEPLDSAIARVTASNMSRLTGSTNILIVEDFVTPDYLTLLELRIHRFEPDDSNQMIFEGTWKLQPTRGGEAVSHYFLITRNISSAPAAPSARVDAMNRCLERLAHEIIH